MLYATLTRGCHACTNWRMFFPRYKLLGTRIDDLARCYNWPVWDYARNSRGIEMPRYHDKLCFIRRDDAL